MSGSSTATPLVNDQVTTGHKSPPNLVSVENYSNLEEALDEEAEFLEEENEEDDQESQPDIGCTLGYDESLIGKKDLAELTKGANIDASPRARHGKTYLHYLVRLIQVTREQQLIVSFYLRRIYS